LAAIKSNKPALIKSGKSKGIMAATAQDISEEEEEASSGVSSSIVSAV
jgi:hypothetical protein